jgi:Fe-S cluster assembly scaffold protein SufB
VHHRELVREKAKQAADKKAALGPDVDLGQYQAAPVPGTSMADIDLCDLAPEEREQLLMAGIDVNEEERAGTYLQRDAEVLHCSTRQQDIQVIPMRQALKAGEWIDDYYWTLVDVDTDKFTAAAELGLQDGYVIRALPESRSIYPIQACLYMGQEGLQQNVHNIIIAEENSELHIITGCATAPRLGRGLHIGVTEFFVKKNAILSFTMIHNWAKEMVVRPRSVARVEAGGLFLSNYVCMRPVRSLQMYPTAHLVGENAVARFYSIIVGSPGSEYDVGGRIRLASPGTRAEMVTRAISNGSKIIARGHLIGQVPGIRAHLECRGLILKGGIIHAIPELEGQADDVEMSHEAAVGKIDREQIAYLMSRGLSEETATSTIVRGFLNVDIPGLPLQLKIEIDQAIRISEHEVM